MENLFHEVPKLREVYDLKGSWIDRHARGGGSTRLDSDWPPYQRMNVSSDAAEELLRQVTHGQPWSAPHPPKGYFHPDQ